MELLEAYRPGIPPTLRDDRLKVEAEQLRQHYMTKSNSEVAEAQQALQPLRTSKSSNARFTQDFLGGWRFRDCRRLQYLLSTQMEDLMKSQKTVQAAVKKLGGPPSGKVIEEATVCHLRPVSHPRNNCVFVELMNSSQIMNPSSLPTLLKDRRSSLRR